MKPYDLYLHATHLQRRGPKREYGDVAQFCQASPIVYYPDLTPQVRSCQLLFNLDGTILTETNLEKNGNE